MNSIHISLLEPKIQGFVFKYVVGDHYAVIVYFNLYVLFISSACHLQRVGVKVGNVSLIPFYGMAAT